MQHINMGWVFFLLLEFIILPFFINANMSNLKTIATTLRFIYCSTVVYNTL